MGKDKFMAIAAAGVLIIAALWLCIHGPSPKTDRARYRRWEQTVRLRGRVVWWERTLPGALGRLLGLAARDDKYWDEHERLGEKLVASGYLTNVTITVGRMPTNWLQQAEIAARFQKTFKGRPDWEFWVSRPRNAIVVTCRPQDVALCRQAIGE